MQFGERRTILFHITHLEKGVGEIELKQREVIYL